MPVLLVVVVMDAPPGKGVVVDCEVVVWSPDVKVEELEG